MDTTKLDSHLEKVAKFKSSVEELGTNLTRSDVDLKPILIEIPEQFNYIIRKATDYKQLIDDTKLFEYLNYLLTSDDEMILSLVIDILHEYYWVISISSITDLVHDYDNAIKTDGLIKNLINLMTKFDINDDLSFAESGMNYSFVFLFRSIQVNFQSSAENIEHFKQSLFEVLSRLESSSSNYQENLYYVLSKCRGMIRRRNECVVETDFEIFVQYLKNNKDNLNASNKYDLLFCLKYYLVKFDNCRYQFVDKFDGLKLLSELLDGEFIYDNTLFKFKNGDSLEEEKITELCNLIRKVGSAILKKERSKKSIELERSTDEKTCSKKI